MAVQKDNELNDAQKRFCEEYIYDFNGSRSYKVAYPDVTDGTARANSSELLTNTNIKEYIKYLQANLAEVSGISRLRVLKEYEKIAFTNISNLHNTWIERKEFETLSEPDKACIESIDTKVLQRNIGTKDEPDIIDIEYVKIKLFDKNKALENISKMLGYNEPEKLNLNNQISTNPETIEFLKKLDAKL